LMVNLIGISKRYGKKLLYGESSLALKTGEKIGLVGSNGCGKTTLLNIIAGATKPDSGEVTLSKGFRIGVLGQEFSSDDKTVLDFVKESIFDHESDIEDLKEKISTEKDPAKLDKLMKLYSNLEHQFEINGGYDLEHKCKKILTGLGFTEEMITRRCSQFSGGQRMRISIAKLLLAPYDAILLDEPTNHLDLPSLLWFENFLQTYPGLLVIISHDQTLLNNVVTKIVEISNNRFSVYTGNYQKYCEQKFKTTEILESAQKRQQKELKKTQRFIDRFRYKNTKARQVQERIKSLQKENIIEVPTEEKTISFDFIQPERTGYEVLRVKNLSKSFGRTVVLDNVSLEIKRGEKVAMTGKNGTGKSTLIKIITDILKADSGEVVLGSNVATGYFAQIHAEQLDLNNSIMEEMEKIRGAKSPTDVRKLLGSFFFRGDDVFNKIGLLSGGEKSRVLLSKLLLSPVNFLLLDEPTNHLDIPSQSVIVDALNNYSGTVCFISHDRYLINKIATRLIMFDEDGITDYPGNYDEYQYWKRKNDLPYSVAKEKTASDSRKEQKRKEAEDRKAKYKHRKKYDEQIEKLEHRLEEIMGEEIELEQKLADPLIYKEEHEAKKVTERYKEVKEEISRVTEKWERLSLEREKWL